MASPLQTIPVTSRHAEILSNGRYSVMVTPSGSGFSRCGQLAVTRWREDPTTDAWGSFVLASDGVSVWAATAQPFARSQVDAEAHVAAFAEGRAQFVRCHDGVDTTLDVAVAGDCNAELRRVTIANRSDHARDIALTSYAELVLGSAAADAAHPAFSKLFVQTEAVEDSRVLLATRRHRTPGDPEVWAAHFAVSNAHDPDPFEFETNRARFLGRGRTLRDARAMQAGSALSNTVGSVLDPIFSVRRRVRVAPRSSAQADFWTLLSDSREAALSLCRSLRGDGAARTLAGAGERAATQRARFGLERAQAALLGQLVSPLLSAEAVWRSTPEVLGRGSGGARVLWTCGISGDRPILLVRISSESGLVRVGDLLRAQRYWQGQSLSLDVVLVNAADGSAGDALQRALDPLLEAQRAQLASAADSVQAGAFALRDKDMSDQVRDALAAVARVVLDASGEWPDRHEKSAMELGRTAAGPDSAAARRPIVAAAFGADLRGEEAVPPKAAPVAAGVMGLEFDNGLGGFDVERREYVITLTGGRCTPMPWINVVANESFGFFVSAEGGGHTWSVNSQQNPLTPWPNDPVSDSPGEVLYLRDEDNGDLWSTTALPIRVPAATYTARLGKGYSRFLHSSHGIELELMQCVPLSDSIKVSRLRIRNGSARVRHLSVTAYVEWALGPNGTVPGPTIITSVDAATGALFARNPWRDEFAERIAFADLGGMHSSVTADRAEFLGRFGAKERPAALVHDGPLLGRVGAGFDPCAALQTRVQLQAFAEIDVVFLMGDADSVAQAQALVCKYRLADIDAIVREAQTHWDDLLNTVQVRTPDRAMDLMLNDWLLYQTVACRMWARTAYYQSSGAYGYRDQLQDAMALCVTRPDLTREHLLRAAARQFVEGDVQHWWLPPAGQGIRTRMTDDRVWLPYVAAHYVAVTADASVLDEAVPFIEGDTLKPGQGEAFFQPRVAPGEASLYEHCARAIDVSLSLGTHGLPLIGTGDWNDGMNRVGEKGKGESVWLGWLLLSTISLFSPQAEARLDTGRVARWKQYAARVKLGLESAGWDGQWYRRGYYDDGTPLGSNVASECKIDAIAQSWSVISGAADPLRAALAMDAVEHHLILNNQMIAPLLTPPFDKGPHDPGYIKAYPPGIRENGGQYTHGAIWSIFAFAALGRGERAAELFAILNPIAHSSTADAVSCYQVEPYVVCADVYSVEPHCGRGGWSWYTGSAGWLYRAGLEAILGFRQYGSVLSIAPCLPKDWPGYEIVFRYRGPGDAITRYEIVVENPLRVSQGVVAMELDGVAIERDAAGIPLVHDGQVHHVRVELG